MEMIVGNACVLAIYNYRKYFGEAGKTAHSSLVESVYYYKHDTLELHCSMEKRCLQ